MYGDTFQQNKHKISLEFNGKVDYLYFSKGVFLVTKTTHNNNHNNNNNNNKKYIMSTTTTNNNLNCSPR